MGKGDATYSHAPNVGLHACIQAACLHAGMHTCTHSCSVRRADMRACLEAHVSAHLHLKIVILRRMSVHTCTRAAHQHMHACTHALIHAVQA